LRDPINADGTSTLELIGASGFPRHWVYDSDGRLAAKAGLADFKEWYRHAFGKHTPWGGEDSRARLERGLRTSTLRARTDCKVAVSAPTSSPAMRWPSSAKTTGASNPDASGSETGRGRGRSALGAVL
jgi:hypothetical protein